MAVVSHAMRRYSTSPSNSYASQCLKGEGSYQDSWSAKEINESSLARSMKYAEPWLYGSMRASGGVLLAPALVLCSCSEYLNGTKRSSKKSPTLCKKCRGTRLPLPSNDLRNGTKFGTVRCYPTTAPVTSPSTPARPETVRVSSHSRPSILPSTDPYELMRRSRLSSENGTQFRLRPNSSKEENQVVSTKSTSVIQQITHGRRSILECSINPYDLMSVESQNKSKNNSDVTLLNGQRIRVKPVVDNYEEVKVETLRQPSQIPKLKIATINKPKEQPKDIPKLIEKESDCNRFKSILKKPTTFSDTDSSVGTERSPSPAQKSGSHFYLPMPMNTPRKKVQFIVENETVSSEQLQKLDLNDIDQVSDLNNEKVPDKRIYENIQRCSEETPESKFFSLRRTVSDRLLHEAPKIVFYDTMALRTRNQRGNTKNAFNMVTDFQKLDGVGHRSRSNSLPQITIREEQMNGHREENFTKTDKSREIDLLEDLQDLDGSFTEDNREVTTYVSYNHKKEIETKDRPYVQKREIEPKEDMLHDNKRQVEPRDDKTEGFKITMKSIDKSTISKSLSCDVDQNTPPVVPPRKRSNSKHPYSVVAIESPKLDQPGIKTESIFRSVEHPNRTVVQIRSSPTVHKIQIRNEFHEPNNIQTVVVSDTAQRKTSIMINGDDCYSTINVNDDVPLYQSSVVVKDSGVEKPVKHNQSSTVYITGNFINVDNEIKQIKAPESTLIKNREVTSPTLNSLSKLFAQAYNTLERNRNLKKEVTLPPQNTEEILKDPVEAIKRNLVPHVCGKSDMHRRPVEKPPEILVDSEEHLANISGLIENSLDIESNKSFIDEDRDEDSENSTSTQYEMLDLGSDCYTDNSNRSSLTEEELNARTKFYELLADSAIAELSESDDHHYESIRINNDPIYEEICPPPLPPNPPPMNIIDDLQLDKQFTTRSIFEGASKYDILSYLVDAKERGIIPEDTYNFGNSDVIIEEEIKEVSDSYRTSHSHSDSSEESSLIFTNGSLDEKKNCQKSAEVERNDSGVGSETSKSSLTRFRSKSELSLTCEDCETSLEPIAENEPLICRKCIKKRSERKEIITEIVETEEKYSRDLQIILEEFYQPMLVAGLLTPDQLSTIFLNVEELLENSQTLAERLRDAVEIAIEQGDEDLLTVNIGKLFLEAAPMLHAFETYCVRQGNASLLLASLEKDKELLRIFLRVSQMENTMLRRMNLNSFLMVPVQRVTKYPLLLTRLYKTTPNHHENREQIKEAQHKVELHLNHMNSETKDVPSKLWRRIGSSGRRASTEMDLVSIKLRKIAVDVLEWNHDDAKFVFEGKLLFTQPTDNNWRKGRTIKLAPINALLVMNGKQINGNRIEDNGLTFPKTGVREAALLLIRDKNGRYSLLREPLYLDRCIIATDPAWQSYFEVQEVIGKDTFIFKAENDELTRKWYRHLQYHAQGLGGWRKRRNALANIMINGMGLRS